MVDKNEELKVMRHSASHVLAQAVLRLYPDTKLAIGPAIEDGFYYDFEFGQPVTEADLGKIEAEMKKIKDENLPLVQHGESVTEAEKWAKSNNQAYKLELIGDIAAGRLADPSGEDSGTTGERSEKVSFYKTGDGFRDLCRGPHVDSTGEIGFFKLLNIAGAYWKGSEKNKMLTRIYGTTWKTKEELDKYLWLLEEAKKRDHKKLGPALGLFMFHETSPGCPYWLDKGLVIYNLLLDYWRKEHRKRGYVEIASPLVNKKELWEISGHWDHYKESMFIADMGENEVYGLKPMNCPNAMIVFGASKRSYRELPLRLSDCDTLHRFEKSGTLSGLLRVRCFRQDDSHNFVTIDQIESEYGEILDIARQFYGIFGLQFRLRLGTRPEKYIGDVASWEKAEASLHKILEKNVGKGNYEVEAGDGAFYGPKIDILMKDSLGRDWQMGTIQLDFQLPERFDLKYIDEKGKEKTPVVIHRVIYGSLERFIGILIEHFAGAFPVWLSPVQVKVIPITDKQNDYAAEVAAKLEKEGVRVEVDSRSETMQAKIRDAQLAKVPYMLIVGEKEEKAGTVAKRDRSGKDEGQIEVEKFIEGIKKETGEKSL